MNDHYLFEGRLISGLESFDWIKKSLVLLNKPASICSAYIKLSVLKEISTYTKQNEIRILARWDLNDLVGGASDIECYKFAKEKGWQFFINNSLHAKIYYLPPSGILSGSANATNSGLGLSPRSNKEASTVIEINEHNNKFIDELFKESLLVTDDIYVDLLDAYNNADKSTSYVQWPKAIMEIFRPRILSGSKFMISECLLSDGNEIFNYGRAISEESINDLSMLSVPLNLFEKEYISSKFVNSKIFLWVKEIIKENNGSINFGGLTHALHNALLEDPKPYRSEVKDLIKNIYSWIRFVGDQKTGIIYDRPNYSEILRISA